MGYVKVKYPKPNNKTLVCPKCSSHRVHQKHESGEFKFLCMVCYWHGTEPIIRDRTQARKTGNIINSVSYEDIIKNLLQGKSIREQFELFGVAVGYKLSYGHHGAVRNKILRVYNCYAEYTKIPCTDIDFVKIRYTPDIMKLLIAAIQEEETKIRNSPRLSVTFSK